MVKLNKIHSCIKENADDDLDYNEIIRKFWDNKIHECMDKCDISFDRENDDRIDSKTIEFNTKDSSKCEVACESWVAGGDWEAPTMYFRCQVKEGYFNHDGKTLSHGDLFVFIPNKSQGNNQLVKNENKYSPIDADSKDSKTLKYDEKKCWDSLRDHIEKSVASADKIEEYDQFITPASDNSSIMNNNVGNYEFATFDFLSNLINNKKDTF